MPKESEDDPATRPSPVLMKSSSLIHSFTSSLNHFVTAYSSREPLSTVRCRLLTAFRDLSQIAHGTAATR